MDAATIVDAVRSIVTSHPFTLTETPAIFDFERVPSQLEGDSVRLEIAGVATEGGFAFSERRTDDLTVWVAQAVDLSDPRETYRALQVMGNSLTSAIVRAGATVGDFAVDDGGRRVDVEQPPGAAYQVLRVVLPVDYMTTL